MQDYSEMTIAEHTDVIVGWANDALPDRTPQSAVMKLFEEVGELVKHPSEEGEYADICIMVFDLARMHGVDLNDAIIRKMMVNEGRAWALTPMGTYQHSGEAPPVSPAPAPEPETPDGTGAPMKTMTAAQVFAYDLGVADKGAGVSMRDYSTLATAYVEDGANWVVSVEDGQPKNVDSTDEFDLDGPQTIGSLFNAYMGGYRAS